jgi:hypothetical protein
MVEMGDENTSRRMRSDRHSPGRHCNRVRRPPGTTARRAFQRKSILYVHDKPLRQKKIREVSPITRARRETEGTKIKIAATGNQLKRNNKNTAESSSRKASHRCRFDVPALIYPPSPAPPRVETRSCLAHIRLHHLLFFFVKPKNIKHGSLR